MSRRRLLVARWIVVAAHRRRRGRRSGAASGRRRERCGAGGHRAAVRGHPESAAAARGVPARDAEGRRPAQPPLGVDLRRELHPVGGRGQPVRRRRRRSRSSTGTCDAAAGRPSAAAVLQDSALYNATIDAWSMRNWPADRNGHDHFFAAFTKFNAGHQPRRRHAGRGHVAGGRRARQLPRADAVARRQRRRRASAASRRSRRDFAQMRTRLLAAGFDAVFTQARQRLDAAEARRNELLSAAARRAADPGCRVTVRYISQVLRAGPPEQVFAQMLAGFELATRGSARRRREPRAAGRRPRGRARLLAAPGDDRLPARALSRRCGSRCMPAKSSQGLVPPEVLRFHIRDSIAKGHALRIGHGVDVMQEDDPIGAAARDGGEEGARRDRAHQQRRHPRRARASGIRWACTCSTACRWPWRPTTSASRDRATRASG